MNPEMLKELILTMICLAIPTIIVVLGLLSKKIINFITVKSDEIKTKTENETLRTYIDLTKENAITIVASLNQTMVDGLKEVSSDGKLTEDDAIKIKDMAVEALTATLSDSMVATLTKTVDDLDKFLSDIVEDAVYQLKLIK